jgi:hypothetical protein
MIVGYFDLLGSCIGPPKDDPPLIIDTDRMFALPIALQRLKSIARRNPKVAQSSGAIDLDKLASGDLEKVSRKSLRRLPSYKDQFSKLAPEAADQRSVPSPRYVSRHDT